MRYFLTSVGAVLACTTSVAAADFGGPSYDGSIKDGPTVATAPIWTGLYVGGHVGYGWGEWDVDLSHSSGAIHYNDPFVPANRSLSSDDNWIGGLQGGYNHQIGSMIVGVESDVSWTGMEADGRFTTPAPNHTTWDIDTSLDVFGTVRTRVGVLVSPQLLVYATGGLAWGIVDAKQATNWFPPANPDVGGRTSGDEAHIGWTAGGGAEWLVAPNWSIQGQYLYVDLGEQDYALKGTTKPGGTVPYVETFSTDLTFHTVRVGVNYKFGH